MSPGDWRDRVQDIHDAITEIQSFTQGMDLNAFTADAKTQRAVELNFIIGEAASQLPDDVEECSEAGVPADIEWATGSRFRA